MVYESFFECKLRQVKTGLEKENRLPGLLLRIGADALDQAVGMSHYTHGFRPFSDTDIDINAAEFPEQNWLVWHLHDSLSTQLGTEKLGRFMCRLAGLAWEERNKAAHICYILPFLVYYETRWNERRGYGELTALVKKTVDKFICDEPVSETKITLLGNRMSAMVQCYGEMSEEAYDQRELFADLLRQYARTFQKYFKPQTGNISLDDVQAAYALMKGIRLGILHHEQYAETAKAILTDMELGGFVCQDDRVYLKDEEGENTCEKVMYCMMAYGEYIMLRKERPYYGI